MCFCAAPHRPSYQWTIHGPSRKIHTNTNVDKYIFIEIQFSFHIVQYTVPVFKFENENSDSLFSTSVYLSILSIAYSRSERTLCGGRSGADPRSGALAQLRTPTALLAASAQSVVFVVSSTSHQISGQFLPSWAHIGFRSLSLRPLTSLF